MPTVAEAFALAGRHQEAGNLQQAEQLYRQIVQAAPGHAEAWCSLGRTCQSQGKNAEAEMHLRQALQVKPGHFLALNYLGIVLAQLGRLEEAASALGEALRLEPEDVDTLNDLGNIDLMRKNFDAAADCYRQALRLQPNHALAHYNLGLALHSQDRWDEAVLCYQQALTLKPGHVLARINLGVALGRLGRWDESIACYQHVLSLRPDMAVVHINLGKAFGERGEWDAAIGCYRQALRLQPDATEAHFNMAVALEELGRLDEALASFEQTLKWDPEHTDARVGWACIVLRQGRFSEGWPAFEHRLKGKNAPANSWQQRRWDGSALAGRTILVHAEQGHGDTLHFFRFVRLLEKQGARVVLQCQPALEKLLGYNLGPANLARHGMPLPPYDVQVPLLSIPGILKITPATIPAEVPYLRVAEQLIEHWRRELEAFRGLKVGITWQGNPAFAKDRDRSMPLASFAPLARVPGVQLISLQKGPGTKQLGTLKEQFAVHDIGSQLDDFMDTAAVIKGLDLVVCCDTAVAHLAGALGIAVWVALPTRPDWRWQVDREDSPWYPTMRLFRQKRRGDWEEVFARMAGEVGRQAAGK